MEDFNLKIHYAGIFDEKPENLPTNNKNHNSIIIINKINNYIVCPLLMITISIPIALKYKYSLNIKMIEFILGIILGLLSLYPHELLHALCYKKDVYVYLKKNGSAFVIGTEEMTKFKYIYTCLLPNIVLGIIPYVTFLINPQISFLGIYSLICIGIGSKDYIDVYNIISQVPNYSRIYLDKDKIYWYKILTQKNIK